MIWLILRVLAFIAALAGLAWLGDWLITADGSAQIIWNGRAYPALSPLEIVIAVILLLIAGWILLKLLGLAMALIRFALGDETAFSRWLSRSRDRRGVDAIEKAQVAFAAGELTLAQKEARKAKRLMGDRDMVKLLTAQLGEATGLPADRKLARIKYRELAREPQTALAGVKGLLTQAKEAGETERAAKLAGAAFRMRPGDAEVQHALFDLQTRAADWRGARTTLETMRKTKTLPRDVVARRGAVLDLEIARACDDPREARERAEAAFKAAPDLAPAGVFLARRQIADGDQSKAARTLKSAWEHGPHPDLAAAFAEIAPEETPAERRKRFHSLLRTKPDHEESRLTAAELAVAEGDYGAARDALGDLPSTKPSHRALALMAAVEKAQGAEEHVVRGWLARAVTAPRGAHWVCELSGASPAEWSAVCAESGGFDTLSWRETDERGEALGAAMLPLVIETEEERAEEERLDEDAAEEAVREAQ